MTGLDRIPGEADLLGAYERLQSLRPPEPGARDLALWSQWSRLDPRLGELWIAHVARRWRLLAPTELNAALLPQPWPAAAGPLLEQVPFVLGVRSREFGLWAKLALSGIRAANHGLYFLGLRVPGGAHQREDARLAFGLYRRWGFLARDLLLNKAPRGDRTLIPWDVRREVLRDLLARSPRITVSDYEQALSGWVGRRQAERDLTRAGLRGSGRTKARIYRA
ncbi:MAG TPA: hypothetical protein VL588_07565 [Bdellovibrionota bacterium]|jgi:hypothetical protein|nr:hypothetical protein [Bdellovibrionota bacterium]